MVARSSQRATSIFETDPSIWLKRRPQYAQAISAFGDLLPLCAVAKDNKITSSERATRRGSDLSQIADTLFAAPNVPAKRMTWLRLI